jgi:hypothetical protein
MVAETTWIQVGDHNTWRPCSFRTGHGPESRAKKHSACSRRRRPDHVFIMPEFERVEAAQQSQLRLVASGVLEMLDDQHGPSLVVEADQTAP